MVKSTQPPDAVERYEICLKGILSDQWSDWFNGMQICHDDQGNSTLSGPVGDQAALFGLLDKIRDLGLPVISVLKLED